ncbi:MAG: hypothetical protein Q8O00_11945 [Holophaga sp.]|nr:hypothetical protein [Holophaga sp.]
MDLRSAIVLSMPFVLMGQSPIQVGTPLPPLLDLRTADIAQLLPKDSRDPAQVEAARLAWVPRIQAFKGAPTLRLRLPLGEARLALLLAASQALRAQTADQQLFLAFDSEAPPLWNESAWGALQGGILAPEDLGPDSSTWRNQLVRAQEFMPGRSWYLWAPVDPGARASMLLGDGGRLVVPGLGPTARLSATLPPGFSEVEGGLGDLTLRHPKTGEARRWRFQVNDWKTVELPKERNEVAVVAKDTYDVGALLARLRATQLRDRLALLSTISRLDAEVHMQASRGTGNDLGFTFLAFEKAGETEELLQKQVRFNGVTANLKGGLQLPLVEARTSIAAPVALSLTERYHYEDGGPGEKANTRVLRFVAVDKDPLLAEGELLVNEISGRILEERSSRSDLPGTVKTERRVMYYGEPAPGLWRVMKIETFERWMTSGGVAQIQRALTYRDFRINDPAFESQRQQARSSNSTMLKQTLEGLRYFNLKKEGHREVELNPKERLRALAGGVLVDPGLQMPVFPFAGLLYLNFNAFGKGIQVNALTAIVFNQVSISVPRLPGGFDLRTQFSTMLLPSTERPVKNGALEDRDGVARQYGFLSATVGHDLGLGFRVEGAGRFEYDRFSESREEKYRTPGFALPPSGLSREWRGELSWQGRGLQLRGHWGTGQRPQGIYGTPSDPQVIPMAGEYRRWGGSVGYDYRMQGNWWLHGEAGVSGGQGFDRFNALGLGGEGGISGIRAGSIASDRIQFAKAGVVLPTGGNFRLTMTLEHARARSIDNQQFYRLTGLGLAGDLPGFWLFTTVRVNLGAGLQSDIPGVRTVNGFVALMRVF